MTFQTSVNTNLPVACDGDFASANPRASVVPPIAGFQCGASGVTIGNFAWATNGLVSSSGQGKPTGYVHRDQQGLNTTYLSQAGVTIPAGFPVTLMRTGDYYDIVTVANATVGQKAFAKFQDGSMQPAATGTTIAGASFTGVQSGTTLTTSAQTGVLHVGDLVTQATGTPAYVLAQLTGTPGAAGTYTLSVSQSVSSGAATATSYIETDFSIAVAALVGEVAVISK